MNRNLRSLRATSTSMLHLLLTLSSTFRIGQFGASESIASVSFGIPRIKFVPSCDSFPVALLFHT